MGERKFKVDDEVVDRKSGWRGRVVRVDIDMARSYDVWFRVPDFGAVRMESDLELASAVDRLGEVAHAYCDDDA